MTGSEEGKMKRPKEDDGCDGGGVLIYRVGMGGHELRVVVVLVVVKTKPGNYSSYVFVYFYNKGESSWT